MWLKALLASAWSKYHSGPLNRKYPGPSAGSTAAWALGPMLAGDAGERFLGSLLGREQRGASTDKVALGPLGHIPVGTPSDNSGEQRL